MSKIAYPNNISNNFLEASSCNNLINVYSKKRAALNDMLTFFLNFDIMLKYVMQKVYNNSI